ncbi:MAG: alpha/beta fold hydrolase [Gammaproteobacteria bacterium]
MESLLKTILIKFFTLFSIISPSLTAKIAWPFFCKPRIQKKPLSKTESKLIQQAKQYYVDSENYKIAVYEWGNSDHSDPKKTILFTHGWGGHALNFSFIIAKLVKGGFNVVAFDSPAHGKSSGNITNLLHNTKALLSVCEHIPSVSVLVGHSFGAMANAYALELTNSTTRFSNIDRLILIAGPNKLTDIFASFTQAMGLSNGVLKIFHQKLEVIAKRNIESMSTVEFLRNYDGETLVIHDHNDRIVPFEEAEIIANEVISATLFATTECGHFRILGAKSVISKIFDFINKPNIN